MDFFEEITTPNGVRDEDAIDMLQELERNTSDEIRRQRTHFRLDIKTRVVLQPGNASELLKFKLQGTTGDLSEGGCRLLLPMPVSVGDIYRLSFDRQQLDLPVTFARCVRCQLLREDAFEAGFKFFSPITLPQNVKAAVGTGGN